MAGKESVTFVLFGGTGDLTSRKLVPAFAKLVHNGKISKDSTIIGISRKVWSDKKYKEFLINSISDKRERSHIKNLNIRYLRGDFFKKGGLAGLDKELKAAEKETSCGRVYYLSTGYRFFPRIVEELKNRNLHKGKNFVRVVFEKPFGEGLKSSEKLDKGIHKVFNEEDVYRIDHYLAKETVQNLNALKFTNPIIYSSFSKGHIESIEIIVDENIGVGNRISYYNNAGAIRDMIQNHLLQVLSLLLMSRPRSLNHEDIHNEKVKILKNIKVLSSANHLLGQYVGYAREAKAAGIKETRTETFVKLVLNCKTRRWDGVNLILRTGKKLPKKFGEIRINYKKISKRLTKDLEGVTNNKLIFGIYPKQDVTVLMNSRKPESNTLTPVKMEFCRDCEFGPNTSNEYAKLLEEIIKGDKTLFTRSDEVRESWKIVEKINKIKSKINFIRYSDGKDPERS